MSYITALATANPPHRFKQSVIADFMIKAMQLDGAQARRLHVLYKATGIETRHSVLEDYGRTQDFDFYENTPQLEPFPSTKKRLAHFRTHALELSVESASRCLNQRVMSAQEITHLIVVSCTGMYAPGLDIDLVKSLGLRSSVERTCINFMGCYASFNALKLATAFCGAQPEAKVLVVCTELCSLHFQKENTDDNLLANALFADGSAALLVESMPQPGLNFRPSAFFCDLAFEGEGDMAWQIGDLGFEMKLSAYVPDVIRKGIRRLTDQLLARMGALGKIDLYAIHPGGKRILEVVEAELGIDRKQNHFAYEVLRKYGNMSSPTVLFVWREILGALTASDHEKKILSFAFGPGLTMESLILTVEHHS